MKNLRASIDILLAAILGLATLVVLAAQIWGLNAQTTRLETGLFSILQFILSLGFSVLITRIVTRQEFTESMKNFAFSAYRRIIDIEGAVDRLLLETERLRTSYPAERVTELDILRVIASGLKEVVESAEDDWGDVIGEELKKLQQIQELRRKEHDLAREKREAASQVPSTNLELEALRQEINELRAGLPYILQKDADEEQAPSEESRF